MAKFRSASCLHCLCQGEVLLGPLMCHFFCPAVTVFLACCSLTQTQRQEDTTGGESRRREQEETTGGESRPENEEKKGPIEEHPAVTKENRRKCGWEPFLSS